MRRVLALTFLLALAALPPLARSLAADSNAAQHVAESGVQGGLVVHLGCTDGSRTAALRVSERYVVHGLDRDAVNVERARATIRGLGLYGPVSVDQWRGSHLPYCDNLVNLLVIEGVARSSEVDRAEILRVLAPGGVAIVEDDAGPASMIRKPWPDDIDQWTHHLHDSGGNAVARDRRVGPPEHLQWTASPRWARSHGWTPSVSAMVSAGGRVFYICDETLTCVDGSVPDNWQLVARDAFSGVLLWKVPVPDWGSAALSGTPGTGAGSTTGRFTMPPNLGRRLVAVGDTVYTTLGADAPVTALDAATGETLHVYEQTAHADEILLCQGRLIVTLSPGPPPSAPIASDPNTPPPAAPGKRVCVVDAASGAVLWNAGPFDAIRATRTQDPLGRLELAAGGDAVFALTAEAIEALSIETGETLWRVDRPALLQEADRRRGFAGVYEFLLTVMVYCDGVVLLAQPEPNSPHTYHTMPGTLYAFDAADGRMLWKHAYGAWGHCTQPDVFVVDDQVWTHVDVPGKFSIAPNGWLKVPNTSAFEYRIQALDLRTGEVRRELPTNDLFDVGHHHRCYRNKITEKYLMASRRGVEFVDLATGENYQNHWVRSGCLLGNLPCNGLLYVAPHACDCYIESKLTGFNALAAARDVPAGSERPKAPRLERGPAYGEVDPRRRAAATADWPTYRHDPQRSGATDAAVGTAWDVAWRSSIGTRPTAPVVAAGKVFVAGVDSHTLHAIDESTGASIWQYTAGARIASPPTAYRGLAIFGANDGRVAAVRASDGALAWRFRAAPRESRVVVEDQLESPWHVPGVLVEDGRCAFAAGRSSYLDGGLHAFMLDATTGEVLAQRTIYSPDAETGKQTVTNDARRLPGMLGDVASSSGDQVLLRGQPLFDAESPGKTHIDSTAGYLDPTWFNRTFWRCGPVQTSGLLVMGRDKAYGMELYHSRSRETVFRPGSEAYRLVCRGLDGVSRGGKRGHGLPASEWEQRLAIRVTALVRAGDVIFAAGSPDVVDPSDPYGAWEGRKGGVLAAFSVADGRRLNQTTLPAPPVWDGMAAVDGKLVLSLESGDVLCLTSE